MTNFAALRRTMVETQVMPADVTDARILRAFHEVPRELFVPPALQHLAYADKHVPLQGGAGSLRQMLAAAPLARLMQLAKIKSDDHVLDVGCGNGYSTALLAKLAASVIGPDEDAFIVAKAQEILKAVGSANARAERGALHEGFAAGAPYNVIFFNGAVDEIPAAFSEQLKPEGRLVAVIGRAASARATLYVKSGGVLTGHAMFTLGLPELAGFRRKESFAFAL